MPIDDVDIQDVLHYYYQASRRTIVQFLDLFNNIRIGRYNNDTGNLESFVKVPLKFAPKSKSFYWVEKLDSEGNRIRDLVLPMMACNLTSMEFAPDRQVSRTFRVKGDNIISENNVELLYNPIPYNYTFNVDIAAEYMIDITQIIEQILPFFDPSVYIRVTIPELSIGTTSIGSYPLDLKVVYDSNSRDIPVTIDESDYRIIKWTLTFKVEGYLFKPKYEYPVIKKIITEWGIRSETEPMPLTTTIGLSADKYKITNLTQSELEGSVYDQSLGLLYKYEMEN